MCGILCDDWLVTPVPSSDSRLEFDEHVTSNVGVISASGPVLSPAVGLRFEASRLETQGAAPWLCVQSDAAFRHAALPCHSPSAKVYCGV
jgi:hypothetical protein